MNRTIGTGGLVMMLVVALAAIGIGIALWSKVLTIQGVVRTGTVNAAFVKVFTDDDDAVDDDLKDSMDTGDCPISIGPEAPPVPPFEDKKTTPGTSCDPAATGRDPKAHYDKDVARCDAIAIDDDANEPQPGSQTALLFIQNAYPSYHCTAWFDVANTGSIPVLLHSVSILGAAAAPCASGASTQYDLNGDTQLDIEICVSELPVCDPNGTDSQRCEPQIDPDKEFQFNLDIHVLQTADQGTSLEFKAAMCLHQWNEETGNCPDAAHDTIIDLDGIASPTPGGAADKQVKIGDPLVHWSASPGPLLGPEGIDTFGPATWVFGPGGNDIHVEDPGGSCASAQRDAFHDANAANLDCVVLDVNGNLADGQPVDCDLETFGAPVAGGAGCDPKLAYHDANGSGEWDNGEDIVYDGNANGIYD